MVYLERSFVAFTFVGVRSLLKTDLLAQDPISLFQQIY